MSYEQQTRDYTAEAMVRFCENAPILTFAQFEFMVARPECPPGRLVDVLGAWEWRNVMWLDVTTARRRLLERADLSDGQLAQVVTWRHMELAPSAVPAIVAHRSAGPQTFAALGHVCDQHRRRASTSRSGQLLDALTAAGPMAHAARAAAAVAAQLDVASTAAALAELPCDAAAEVFTALVEHDDGEPDLVAAARAAASAVRDP